VKKLCIATIITLALTASLAVAGCGGGPAGSLQAFLGAERNGDHRAAEALCYDSNSYREITDAIAEELHVDGVKIVSVAEQGTRKVREHGFATKSVTTVEALLEEPGRQLDARYKPLLDSASAELADAQLELKSAQEQLKYSAETYGRNMPQYYAEQQRIWKIQPRVSRAQSKVDTLNAQYQAELAAITAAAEDQHKKAEAERDKLLAKNSVRLPACRIEAVFGKSGSSVSRTFTLVEYGKKWNVYSVAEPAAAGTRPGAKTTSPSTTPSSVPTSSPASSPSK
jgi:hypothetical protein